jgi:hypothetical protein
MIVPERSVVSEKHILSADAGTNLFRCRTTIKENLSVKAYRNADQADQSRFTHATGLTMAIVHWEQHEKIGLSVPVYGDYSKRNTSKST